MSSPSQLSKPAAAPRADPRADMVFVPGGEFRMGSDRHYPEEAPVHRVRVDGFWIDRTPVTNRQFRKFVNATGHVTFAEIAPDPKDYPGALPHMLKAGSLVFTPPSGPVDLSDWSQWWKFKFGANWRRPYGPRSLDQRARRPSGRARRLPRRRGLCALGRQGAADRGRMGVRRARRPRRRGVRLGRRVRRRAASTWPTPGRASFRTRTARPTAARAPRRSAPSRPTATACYDMIGNVWEWTTDFWSTAPSRRRAQGLLRAAEPARRRRRRRATIPASPQIRIPRKVLKGGSHLCAPNYCRRYRPAARHAEPVDTSTSHVGFRCVVRAGPA